MNTTLEDDEQWFEHRSCGRKRRYASKAEAMRGRKVLSERLRIYGPCEFCHRFHIGGGSEGGQRKARKHREKKPYKRKKETYA